MSKLVQNFLTAWKLPRWRWALMIAVVSDAVGFGVVLVPPVQWLLDAVTAAILLPVLGFRWPLLGALAIEAVPVLQVFPAWTLVVAALAGTENQHPAPPGPGGRSPEEKVKIIPDPTDAAGGRQVPPGRRLQQDPTGAETE